MSLLENINSPDDVKKLNNKELALLADEIRSFLVENVMHSGGHLASNLGVVELTLALMKTFDFPKDKIVFDVGHQCYVYKMLTGRKDLFESLRHLGGISGFPRTHESKYDFFDVGHAGTAISAAVGMARARDLTGGDEHIIAFVGDGALTSGMCFEALNDIGSRKSKVIIILNDNAMSIHKNVGGLSLHLSNLRFAKRYVNTKSRVQDFFEHFGNTGKKINNVIRNFKERIKYATIASPVFEKLGLTYIGIVDGNSTKDVINALENAKKIDGPVLIHTFTKKGLGYVEAENNPSKFHGISSETSKIFKGDISYDAAFSGLVCRLGEENPSLIAITAAMASGCGLVEFSERFPDRFFDVGIAEEHAVTMAAGMARGGLVPVVCIYSTFLQRSYDQIIHDVCLQNLHVVFAIGHAGLTGEDGETHQGLLDLAMLLPVSNMTILVPSNYDEFREMMNYAVNECKGPVAVRYPKAEVPFKEYTAPIDPLSAEVISDGSDVLVVSCGRMAEVAQEVSKELMSCGVSAAVANVRCIKPLDKQTLTSMLKGKKMLVTIEDGITEGGMGQYVTSMLDAGVKTINFGFDTCFVQHGKQKELFELQGLDSKSIAHRVLTEFRAHNQE